MRAAYIMLAHRLLCCIVCDKPYRLSCLQVAAIACTGHDASVHLEATLHLATFPEWTMDGLIWQGCDSRARVAVGLSNNSVAVYEQAAGVLQVSRDPCEC